MWKLASAQRSQQVRSLRSGVCLDLSGRRGAETNRETPTRRPARLGRSASAYQALDVPASSPATFAASEAGDLSTASQAPDVVVMRVPRAKGAETPRDRS